MYSYAGAPAGNGWYFMMPPMMPRMRNRNRRRRDDNNSNWPDPWEQLFHAKQMLKQWEEELNKEKKKEDKKPPSGWEQLQMFMAQISVMIVFGYPLGLLFIKAVENLYK